MFTNLTKKLNIETSKNYFNGLKNKKRKEKRKK